MNNELNWKEVPEHWEVIHRKFKHPGPFKTNCPRCIELFNDDRIIPVVVG